MTGVLAKRKPPAAGKGRKRGNPNQLTKSAKQAFELAFDGLGGVDGLITWAKKHRTQFYRLYARLIPPGALTNGPLVNINLPAAGQPIRDVGEASRVYASILGNPDADLRGISFAAPEPSGAVLEAVPICEPSSVEGTPTPAPDPRVEPRPLAALDAFVRLADEESK